MAEKPTSSVMDWLDDSELIELESGYDPLLFLSASIISQAIEDLLAPPFIKENRRSRKMFRFLFFEREKERYESLAFLRNCLHRANPYIIYLTTRYPNTRIVTIIEEAIEQWRWNSWKELVKMELEQWSKV